MNRRNYLTTLTAGGIAMTAGCTALGEDDEAESSQDTPYPPYPDSITTERSGNEVGRSDTFEIENEGPTIIEIEHEGEGPITVSVDDADDTIRGVLVQAAGPFKGASIFALTPGTYELNIAEVDEAWSAVIHDLPVYEDGIGIDLPIDRNGRLYSVIGPINFDELNDTTFEFEGSGSNHHEGLLIDRNGESQGLIFEESDRGDQALTLNSSDQNESEDKTEDEELESEQEQEQEDEDSGTDTVTIEPVSVEISGVGFVAIKSFGEWNLNISNN